MAIEHLTCRYDEPSVPALPAGPPLAGAHVQYVPLLRSMRATGVADKFVSKAATVHLGSSRWVQA